MEQHQSQSCYPKDTDPLGKAAHRPPLPENGEDAEKEITPSEPRCETHCLQSSRLIAFNRDAAPKTPRERLRLMRYRRARAPAICLAWLVAFSTTAAPAADANRSALPGGWHLIRTKNPNGGPDAVSVSHTADVIRSDLDFAGVMLRCGEKDIEVIVVAVTPFSPRAKPEVTVRVDAQEWRFSAQVIPPGAELQLPVEAVRLASGSWRSARELTVQVVSQEQSFAGVVGIEGIGEALAALRVYCTPD